MSTGGMKLLVTCDGGVETEEEAESIDVGIKAEEKQPYRPRYAALLG